MIISASTDYRAAAQRRLPPFLFHYIDGGAYAEHTLRRNVEDLAEIALRQRILRNVADLSLEAELLGERMAMPVALGPVGLTGMYARRGEVQAARAAASRGIPFTLSTVSVCAIEEVAPAIDRPMWFQLYVLKDRGFMRNALERAKAAGVTTLVFTVDMPTPGARYRDAHSGMSGANAPLRRMLQAVTHPRWAWDVGLRGRPHDLGNISTYRGNPTGLGDYIGWLGSNFDPSISWKDLEWIREFWTGPMVIKGILDPEDARDAVRFGADGIVVSNHGGRQLAAVLGSRPLAWTTAWLCGLMALGAWVDAAGALFRPDRVLHAATDLAVSAFGAVMGAWLFHHSVTGLRDSLQEARQRSQELARKRDELQVEMQERERSRDQLVHAMKMDNVGRLASGIAHDFNHLLALIQGYVAKARRSEGEVLQAALQGADSATRRASAVSRRLLDFSRLEPGRPQLLDAAATLVALAPTLEQVFDAGVRCEVDTGGVQRLIHFDPAQLESILLSLAVNANQAMPDGGRFTLRLQPPDPDGRLVLQLQDTGQGMSESVRARCLEPFFTTKPVGQGTGLGLSVTASLVEAAGGAVQVHSRPGDGTRIDLQFPSRPLAA